jgi:hypothetical protein
MYTRNYYNTQGYTPTKRNCYYSMELYGGVDNLGQSIIAPMPVSNIPALFSIFTPHEYKVICPKLVQQQVFPQNNIIIQQRRIL